MRTQRAADMAAKEYPRMPLDHGPVTAAPPVALRSRPRIEPGGPASLARLTATAALALLLGGGGLLGWAALTPIERAVIAAGSVVAEGRRKTVTLLESGILREMPVREGDAVAAGQVLMRLDVTQAESVANQARAQRWAATARMTRLRAEQRAEREMSPPQELAVAAAADAVVTTLLEAEADLLRARWAAFDGALAVQERRIAQLQEQVAANQAQRAAAATRLRTLREELSGVNHLLARGFATRTRQLELQRNEAEALGSLGQFSALEAQAREAISHAEAETANIRLTRASDIAQQVQETQAAAVDAAERLRSALDVLQRREVTAPEAGVVTDIRHFTPGSSITAGQPVLDLVPADDRLVVEARIPPGEVESVQVGQRVNVRLSAYRQQKTPLFPGRLVYLSADRQTDPTGTAFFLARAELDMQALALVPGVQPAAGMPAEVFVLGERRSVLDYVLQPLTDSMRRALRD
jgi:HlyD family secretion protein